MNRTDQHRPSQIIPADYEFVLTYALATTVDGWPQPSWNVNCTIQEAAAGAMMRLQHAVDGGCCVVKLRETERFAATGGTGNCTVCGAAFVYGEVWKHKPTGEHIHLGHICAEKYGLLADLSELERFREGQKAARARDIVRAKIKAERQALYDANPGLEEALALEGNSREHAIITDIRTRSIRWGINAKQIALVLKLADTIKNPPPADVHVDAPEGRLEVEGTIVSIKEQLEGWGGLKMTVKVTTPAGVWLCWGTLPRGAEAQRGDTIKFKATLTRSDRDKHFAFAKRPTNPIVTKKEVTQ